MNKKEDRRKFLKKLTVSGLGVAAFPAFLTDPQVSGSVAERFTLAPAQSNSEHAYNGTYSGACLNRIAFPVGGLGAGMFCVEGTGAFSHVSLRHHPEVFNAPDQFAALSIKGLTHGAKVLEGPVPDWKKFGLPGAGNGMAGSNYGLPRFEQAEFQARFPFCTIRLQDADMPFGVQIKAWSPFVPGDEDASSLPVAGLEYEFENTGSKTQEAVFSYNCRNFMVQPGQKGGIEKLDRGLILSQKAKEEEPWRAGDFAVFTDDAATVVDYCWFRGGWWDPLTMAWETIKKGEVKANAPVGEGAPGGSLYVPFTLAAGQKKTIRLQMAWYVPHSNLRLGKDASAEEIAAEKSCDPASGCCLSATDAGLPGDKAVPEKYEPWYAGRFKNLQQVVAYWRENYVDLKRRSDLFKAAFYASSLPEEVLEAIAANLTILKSPTVLRQKDGRFWAFEGCSDNNGCCHGSCTHVWNYAQAVAHLFPRLERSLRDTEFCEDQNAEGHQMFRADLPIRPLHHDFYAAADGQLGGIMKVHREWRISGDDAWLKTLFPLVQKSMDYCISTWDPKGKGVVEEPHHNTYDIEFWGPDGMCTSFYLGALLAFIRMGRYLKKPVTHYETLYKKGKVYLEQELFDGDYFFQQIKYKDLEAANPAVSSEKTFGGKYSPEALKLLQKEGPKYQYGTGCLSDGILGAWIAAMCGLEDVVDAQKIKKHLLSVHQYNLKKNLSDHANPQRPAYAWGDEGGLLLCTWPKGGKLELPFVYSDEVWTGIEYQVAAHLMLEGLIEEGCEVVRACRDRYDGRIRNPFDEYECGHWYARALSSYGMLQGLTGLRYDAVDKTLYMHSKLGDFCCFIATETGFGTAGLRNGKPFLDVAYGDIAPQQFVVDGKKI